MPASIEAGMMHRNRRPFRVRLTFRRLIATLPATFPWVGRCCLLRA
ncbi:hypothetical protein F8B43_2428 [Methylorubrum populi]|uniref:Uncharacterized protein n=1 Tax=Methylorubrum populi TaxID=223967 RepID=A0A833N1K7_9HYPH|nr:hypothetical protein F8B43_2428 [Methylorubrum populi]